MAHTLAVVGGTGRLGSGLAKRWARAGRDVVIGSRDSSRAVETARELSGQCGSGVSLRGADNLQAAHEAGIVVLTVPFDYQLETLRAIAPGLSGSLLVDATVPLVPPRVARVQLPPEGSAARRARALLGEGVELVSAFHNVAAQHVHDPGEPDCDVLVFGDRREARQQVVELAWAAGLRALHAGSLDNSVAAEAMTSVLLFINRHYGGHAGLRITAPGGGS